MARLKVFAVIANYGTLHKEYVRRLISELRALPFDVTIEVLSESEKDFGPTISVRVGLPGKSPWSLPFAYKEAFLERKDEFDLYVYCEDDVLLKENNIRAFLDASSILPENTIAGFTRCELDEYGRRYYIDIFDSYHFVPSSVFRCGADLFAHLTNEHAGCFILTKRQLARALSSPGFLQRPRKGLYGLPETAATEPYTQCGLRKVICISRFRDFVLHHLPNKYYRRAKHSIVTDEVIDAHHAAMLKLSPGELVELFPAHVRVNSFRWAKNYYYPIDREVISCVPRSPSRILSIGCGIATTEIHLARKGHSVTGIPLDGIVSSYARSRGVRMLSPTFDDAFAEVGACAFDAILLINVLEYVEEPSRLLKRCYSALAKNGVLVVKVANFFHSNYLRQLGTGNIGLSEASRLGNYGKSGVHATSRRRVAQWMKASGFDCRQITAVPGEGIKSSKLNAFLWMLPDFLAARELVLLASKAPMQESARGRVSDRGRVTSAVLEPSAASRSLKDASEVSDRGDYR